MTVAANLTGDRMQQRSPRSNYKSGRSLWMFSALALAVLSGALTIWSITNASRSSYYAAVAYSMSQNWTAFLFGSVDPASTVTIDKIPGAFWIPALFVKAFGFSTVSIVLPNALAAIGATVLLAVTAKSLAGQVAGLIAGIAVATTPVLVAVSRSNQPEALFVLGLAATAWAGVNAIRRQRLGWLTLSGLLIAFSFQCYMIVAWAVWPAIAAGWLATKGPWFRKLWMLALAGLISLLGSLTWVLIVSAVPSDDRPYIGSTITNSPWEMVFGYNALGRIGEAGATGYRSFAPPFSGEPTVWRLFNEQLAGQISWLLPAAIFCLVALWILKFSRPLIIFFAVLLVTLAVMFSVVNGMHQFYTAALVIPLALLIGVCYGLAHRRRVKWIRVALVGITGATALALGARYGEYTLIYGIVQFVIAAITACLVLREQKPVKRQANIRTITASLAVAALFLTPFTWSVVAISHPSAINPVAGGQSDGVVPKFSKNDSKNGAGIKEINSLTFAIKSISEDGFRNIDTKRSAERSKNDLTLIRYLKQHRTGEPYLAAVFGAQRSAELMIEAEGLEFLPIGGFSGTDPVPTPSRFRELVAEGHVRYVLLSGGGLSLGVGEDSWGQIPSVQIRTWASEHCTKVQDLPVLEQLYKCGSA